jgi:hypothetical protein
MQNNTQSGTNIFDGLSRSQGGITPYITNYSPGNNFNTYYIGDVEMDTTQMPRFSNLTAAGNNFGGAVIFNQGGSGAVLGYSDVQGPQASTVIGSSGQNFNATNGVNYTNQAVFVTANGQFMYPISNALAPSLSLGSGGSVPVGQTCYGISVVDINGNESLVGPYACVTTTSGSPGQQTVTVTPPAAPAGAVGWRPYRSSTTAGGSLANIPGCSFLPFGMTYVDTFAFTCGETTPTTNRAGAQTLGGAGLSGSALNLVGGGFKNTLSFSGTANRTLVLPDSNAIVVGLSTFATLNTAIPISLCADCTIANPCTGSGTGALAKRLGGVWVCN